MPLLSRMKYIFPLRTPTKYRLASRLVGHTDAVLSLAVSQDGVLASGGLDGLRLWSFPHGKPIPTPAINLATRGLITCLTWVPFEKPSNDILIYGTTSGYIGTWCRDDTGVYRESSFHLISAGAEILSLARNLDSTNQSLIAISARDGTVQLFNMNAKGNAKAVLTVRVDFVPRSLHFGLFGRDLSIVELQGGRIVTLSVATGAVSKIQAINCFIVGNAEVDERRRQIVVDNTFDGFDLFTTNDSQYIQTFVAPRPTIRYPKQVTFGESSAIVVGGSDDGRVRVYDTNSGDVIDVLRHADKGLVQTITTHTEAQDAFIVAAGSGQMKYGVITIWTRALRKSHPQVNANPSTLVYRNTTSFTDSITHKAIYGILIFLLLERLFPDEMDSVRLATQRLVGRTR